MTMMLSCLVSILKLHLKVLLSAQHSIARWRIPTSWENPAWTVPTQLCRVMACHVNSGHINWFQISPLAVVWPKAAAQVIEAAAASSTVWLSISCWHRVVLLWLSSPVTGGLQRLEKATSLVSDMLGKQQRLEMRSWPTRSWLLEIGLPTGPEWHRVAPNDTQLTLSPTDVQNNTNSKASYHTIEFSRMWYRSASFGCRLSANVALWARMYVGRSDCLTTNGMDALWTTPLEPMRLASVPWLLNGVWDYYYNITD